MRVWFHQYKMLWYQFFMIVRLSVVVVYNCVSFPNEQLYLVPLLGGPETWCYWDSHRSPFIYLDARLASSSHTPLSILLLFNDAEVSFEDLDKE